MKPPLTLCLLFHSTRSHNLGVGALTVGHVAILREVAAELGRTVRFIVPDWKDARASYLTGEDIELRDLDGAYLKRPNGFWRDLRAADAVLDIGGGDSFADIYGPKRLRLMFAMTAMAHLARRPFIFAPQTVGPFSQVVSKRLARAHLARCRVVAVRDQPSKDCVKELGGKAVPLLASDVAFGLPAGPSPDVGTDVNIGLNVSGLLMGGGYTGRNEFGLQLDYPALIRDLIGWFQGQGATVHLIPHVIVPDGPMTGEDDHRACAALAQSFPGTVLAPAFQSPSEAKGYIAAMDFFMGARMHACIAALSSGVPVVPMAYSRKFAGLFGSLGYDQTVDCTSTDGTTIKAAITAAFANRSELAAAAQRAADEGRVRLAVYRDGVRDGLAQL